MLYSGSRDLYKTETVLSNENFWGKPPHVVALASLRALTFPLPSSGSKICNIPRVWSGFTPFMLVSMGVPDVDHQSNMSAASV